MFRSIFTNSFGILASRVLGFIRDMMMASVLGANIFSDIFFVAFKLPNLFRRIFAEGAFSQTFIPAFTHSKHKALFAIKILLSFSFIILFITLLVELFSKEATFLIAFGFDSAIQALAAPYVALNFYYLLLIFWVSFFAALLQYKNHFATTAFAPTLLNLALITALLLAKDKAPQTIVWFLSYGVLVGGMLQLGVHLVALYKKGLCPLLIGGIRHFKHPKKSQSIELKRQSSTFKKEFIPAIWGNSTAQVSAFLDTALASFLAAGSISYLYYANRVFQLPLALFAIATSVALFPKISRAIKKDDISQTRLELKKGFILLLFLLSGATLAGMMLSQEIVWLLFERGAFGEIERIQTAQVLQIYLLGLLPFGLSKLFILYIYAKQEQKKAAFIATLSLGINALLALALITPLGLVGLALAGTIGGFVYLFMTLYYFGFSHFLAMISPKLLTVLLLFLLILAAVCYLIKELFYVYL